MPDAGVVPLTDDDLPDRPRRLGRWPAGRLLTSDVMLNDWRLIEEFDGFYGASGTGSPLHALGDEAADHFRRCCPMPARSSTSSS